MSDKQITPVEALTVIVDTMKNIPIDATLHVNCYVLDALSKINETAKAGLQAASQPTPGMPSLDKPIITDEDVRAWEISEAPPIELERIPFDPNRLKAMEGHEERAEKSWEEIQKRLSQPPAVKGIDATPFESNTERHSVTGLTTGEYELAFIPCASDDPRRIGAYQSTDGESEFSVRELHLPVEPKGADPEELTVQDYIEVLEDHKRLVRELDTIINGPNAAKQASLCDIVGQLANEWKRPTGAIWVKASDRLPKSWNRLCARFIHTKIPLCAPETWISENERAVQDIEWLDESPTAAGEVPRMQKEHAEQMEVNVHSGMSDIEASFQSGYSFGHDAGYIKAKMESAAGDGKEAIDETDLIERVLQRWASKSETIHTGDGDFEIIVRKKRG